MGTFCFRITIAVSLLALAAVSGASASGHGRLSQGAGLPAFTSGTYALSVNGYNCVWKVSVSGGAVSGTMTCPPAIGTDFLSGAVVQGQSFTVTRDCSPTFRGPCSQDYVVTGWNGKAFTGAMTGTGGGGNFTLTPATPLKPVAKKLTRLAAEALVEKRVRGYLKVCLARRWGWNLNTIGAYAKDDAQNGGFRVDVPVEYRIPPKASTAGVPSQDAGESRARWHVALNGTIRPLNATARYLELGCPTKKPPGWVRPHP